MNKPVTVITGALGVLGRAIAVAAVAGGDARGRHRLRARGARGQR